MYILTMLKTITTSYNSFYLLLTIQCIQSVISDSENFPRTTFTDEEFNTKTLITLNNYRKLHGVPPLEFDSQLAEHAVKWALRIQEKSSNDGQLRAFYSHPHVEGENVMVRTNDSGPIEGSAAIDSWYSEVKSYDFSKHRFSYETAQFTQLVWKGTEQVGIAMVHDSTRNHTVVVGRFKPPGNIGPASSFQENVRPLLTGATHKTWLSTSTPKPEFTERSVNLQQTLEQEPKISPVVSALNSDPEMKDPTTTKLKELTPDPMKMPLNSLSAHQPSAVTSTPMEEEVSKPKSTGKYPNVNASSVSKSHTKSLAPAPHSKTSEKTPPGRNPKSIEKTAENNPLSASKLSAVSENKLTGRSITNNTLSTIKLQTKSDKKSLEIKSQKPADIKKHVKKMNETQKLSQQTKPPIYETEIESSTDAADDMTASVDLESESVTNDDEDLWSSTESSESETAEISTTSESDVDTSLEVSTTTKLPKSQDRGRTIDTKNKPKPPIKNPELSAAKNLKQPNQTILDKSLKAKVTTTKIPSKAVGKDLQSNGRFIDSKKSESKSTTNLQSKTTQKPPLKGRTFSKPNVNYSSAVYSKNKPEAVTNLEVTSESPSVESDSEEFEVNGRSFATDDEAETDTATEKEESVEIDTTTVRSITVKNFNVPPDQMKFAQEGLAAHNKYRKIHGVPPLTLDPELVFDSYEWAKESVAVCDSKPKCFLTNTKRQDRGENIYAVKGISRITGFQPVDYWYKEIKHYNWTKPGYQWKSGHFTAVVWKNTKKMGMAWSKGQKGIYVAVAMYNPPGNVAYPIFYRSNVLPMVRKEK